MAGVRIALAVVLISFGAVGCGSSGGGGNADSDGNDGVSIGCEITARALSLVVGKFDRGASVAAVLDVLNPVVAGTCKGVIHQMYDHKKTPVEITLTDGNSSSRELVSLNELLTPPTTVPPQPSISSAQLNRIFACVDTYDGSRWLIDRCSDGGIDP